MTTTAASSTTAIPRSKGLTTRERASPVTALIRRAFLDARARTVAFAYIFAVYAWLQAAGYHSAYPTLADRLAFAKTFAGNSAIRLFYGYPYDVVSVGGYSAWRVGGTLALAAAAFGVLAAVRSLRAEEDAGRTELVLAGAVGRRSAFLSSMVAIAAGVAILWLAETVGFVIGGLPVGGSAYLALATASVVIVFTGIGAVASQLAPTRRIALGIGAGSVVLFWLLRVVSDIVGAAAWVRWTTPLGWAEELRPFAGSRPAVLVLPIGATVPLLVIADRVWSTRDVGAGLLPLADTASPSYRLLSSPTAQALRRQRGVLAVWTLGVSVLALIMGSISTSISTAGLSENIRKDLAKLGSGSITTPAGYLSWVFIIFIFAICMFVCSQVGAARQEEAEQQLETVLALPVSRYRWLGGRLLLAVVAAGALSGLLGLFTWAGAASQGVHVSLPKLLEAGANCLPISIMFLGLSALAYAILPRASSVISYTLVGVAFLWFLVGSLAGVPKWLRDITPFEHIGLVPAQPFRVADSLVMVAIGLAAAGVALWVFRRRDLFGA